MKTFGHSTREIKKVLYITMSNLGDAVMGLPAFDFLRRECPSARITVVAAPRTKCLFEHHPDVAELIVFDKHSPLKEKIGLYWRLEKGNFDVIVDLKNSFYRWSLKARHKNPCYMSYPAWSRHFYKKHLLKAVRALRKGPVSEEEFKELDGYRNPSFIGRQDTQKLYRLLEDRGIKDEAFFLLVPGSRSFLKQWSAEGYAKLVGELHQRYGKKIVIAGDESDREFSSRITRGNNGQYIVDLCGKTSIGMLCALIMRSSLVIGSDSGCLQIASYLDKPVVGLYGPTDHGQYGPWSSCSVAVRKNVICSPCSDPDCRSKDHACMKTILPYDVLLAARLVLEGKTERFTESRYRRILVSRTDRLGDVLLSTPALKALRERYPSSFIAVMVSPYTSQIVQGNPYIDEVIVFDKAGLNGFFSTLAFSRRLAKYRFDLAVVLHPTVRVHFIAFLAGIRERVGYDWRAPYFLTKAVPHRKHEGRKHEIEYNFDLLKEVGVEEASAEMYMPVDQASENLIEDFLKRLRLDDGGALVALNPAASCPSKLWPVEKFARLSDELQRRLKVKVLVVSDAAHREISEKLFNIAALRPVDCSGMFSLRELACLFKRCGLLISNDSGPVHIAVAVGTPVISIFGRNQAGLSPSRWGPVGPFDAVLHKPPSSCEPCLAHDCKKGFQCLSSISVEEVIDCAEKILRRKR